MRVAVVGGINVDVISEVDRQPDDDRPAVISAIAEGPGGKGANQAIAAARLGAEVELLGAVGDDDAGWRVVGRLRAMGIGCDAVATVPGECTGRVVGLVTSTGSKRTAALPGANLRLTPQDVRSFEPAIRDADVVVVQLEPPAEVVAAVLDAARDAGVPALLDVAPAQGPFRDLVPLATWVTANRAEASSVTGLPVEDEVSARGAAEALRSLGPSIVGLSVGGLGHLLATGDGTAWEAVDRSPVVDTTGAGDAFAATLAVLLASGTSPSLALRYASAASTLACRRLGAQAALPTMAEIEATL